MGQKVDPRVFRIGITRDWNSRWFARGKEFSELLLEDANIRALVKKKLYGAGIARTEIERAANRIKVTIHTARPGMVIGRGGAGVEELRKQIEGMTAKQVSINIVEVKVPELDAQLVAESIAAQLEKRISYRRAMKQAVTRAIRLGAKGVKVIVAGRLAGAEIARSERYVEGTVPLHTLRADIDYGFAEARTTYGQIGVKVWVYKGDVIPEARAKAAESATEGEAQDVDAKEG